MSKRIRCRAIIFVDDKIVSMYREREGRIFYTFPGGGMEENESEEICVKREVMEEFGIVVEPRKIIYECNFNNLNQCYIVCDWVDGEVHVTDGEEYDRMTEENQYYPTTIDVDRLAEYDFRPHEIRDELIKDLKAYDSLLDVDLKIIEVIK
jgi:8-oxo-dGTP pyrophosphatase MutT (NUDIX family)